MSLSDDLTRALLQLADDIKLATASAYNPTEFRRMVASSGGLPTAKGLIARSPSDGYLRLAELQRTDLTLEAFILKNPKFWPLFSETELAMCRKRAPDA